MSKIIPPLEQCKPFSLVIDSPSPLNLDHYLAQRLERTLAEIRHWVRQGHVHHGGQPLRFRQPPPYPATLSINPPVLEPSTAMPEALPLERVYEDDYLVVVNKPAGMATHPSSGWWRGSCVSALLHHIREWPGIKGVAGPGIVHRLDKNTSGLLLFAKTHLAQQGLLQALKRRDIEREYVAVTARWTEEQISGTWSWPLGRDPQHALKECVRSDGKPAITHYFHVAATPAFSLVALKLETGRTHQIRVHLQKAGTPILNDGLYGAPHDPWPHTMALHAYHLRFQHPITQEQLCFYRPPSWLHTFGISALAPFENLLSADGRSLESAAERKGVPPEKSLVTPEIDCSNAENQSDRDAYKSSHL